MFQCNIASTHYYTVQVWYMQKCLYLDLWNLDGCNKL